MGTAATARVVYVSKDTGVSARLATAPNEVLPLVASVEYGAVTSALRGLAEYMVLSGPWLDANRDVTPKRVFFDVPDKSMLTAPPVGTVELVAAASYNIIGTNPGPGVYVGAPPDVTMLRQVGEATGRISFTYLHTDSRACQVAAACVESSAWPQVWSPNILLFLPFYHNARADYTLVESAFDFSAEAANLGQYMFTMVYEFRVPLIQVYQGTTAARPRFILTVDEKDLDELVVSTP